jgi:Zn-finger protein
MCTKDLEKMCRTIDTFTKEEHINILKIIIEKDSTRVSENNNGTFIHMEDLSDEILNNIQKYIDYVLLKEGDIQKIEDKKEKIKNDINDYTYPI